MATRKKTVKKGGAVAKKPAHGELRRRARAAIGEAGLAATAARIGVQADTLQRFCGGVGTSHPGTVALIEKALGS
jgi:hypothetical protein